MFIGVDKLVERVGPASATIGKVRNDDSIGLNKMNVNYRYRHTIVEYMVSYEN